MHARLRAIDRVPRDGSLGSFVERVEVLHVGSVEFKVLEIRVRLDPSWRVRFRERHCGAIP